MAHWSEIARRLAGRRVVLFLDYDGTLSPIVQRPELALLPDETRAVVGRLAERMPVAILSGRRREEVAALVDLPGLVYAGSHGFDIAGPAPAAGGAPVPVSPPAPGAAPAPAGVSAAAAPLLRHLAAPGVETRLRRVAERLRRELAGIDGVLVEDKRFAVAVHYRLVADRDLPRIEAAVDRAAGAAGGGAGDGGDGGDGGDVGDIGDAGGSAAAAGGGRLRKTGGKKVWELRPDVDWDKGRALLWLFERYGGGHPDALPLVLGDDVTDESAFAAAASRGGIGILVAEEPRPTAAAFRLRDPAATLALLTRLAELATAPPRHEPGAAPVGSRPAALAVDAPLTGEWRPGQIQILGPLAVPGHSPRLVRVYLPSTFTPEVPRFALYMFDGQNVFDDPPSFAGGWHLHAAVEKLARSKRPAPIVVGIDHGGQTRIDELSPFGAEVRAGSLDVLLDWLAGSLIPRLAAALPLLGGPVGAVVGGSSMGGLAALYAHFRRPRDFGGALAMSPSFWLGDGEILRWVAAQPVPEMSRIYLDCGVKEGRGMVLPQVAAMAAQLANRGYDPDRLMFRADPRGAHSEASWRRRLPRALRFFYRHPASQG